MYNEFELLVRAKAHLSRLAEGYNPFTEEALPNDTVLSDPRMIRCLYFSVAILQKVIDNGGDIGTKRGSAKSGFCISDEELKRVHITQAPIPISSFVAEINNAVTDKNMKKLSAPAITNWLVAQGFLQLADPASGKRHKITTEQSKYIGISSELRNGPNGTYTALLYNAEAQQFILDNLNSILQQEDAPLPQP
ncbi:MAG TPA: hypothetical protein VN366_10545 [Feifaniaceae bacterium]|nr:hypothetical protein [Feifaniaceae bacterium]